MKRVFLVIVTFCFCLVPSGAFACVCGSSDPPAEFNRAKAIFIGEMLGGTEKLSVKDEKGKSEVIEAGAVRFTVEEVFKGNVINETTIEIASMEGTSCGPYGLTRGERYLVYAYGDEKDDAILHTGVCTRTKPANPSYAKEDLDFLRNLPPAGTGGNLRGRISADLRAGGVTWLPDVKVNIQNADNQVITVRTDKEGKFEVRKLKAGKYKVEPEFPPNYLPSNKSVEVTIEDRGTADVGFGAVIDSRVGGRVVDRDGRGFNNIFLQFEGGAKSIYGHSLGEEGAFEVVGAPPGEYLLYIEMQSEDYKRRRKYYYPGTFKLDEATTIKVGLGERIEGLEFLLPEEFKVHTVEGRVTWKNGKPAADVEVLLICMRSPRKNGVVIEFGPTSTKTDKQGRFRLEGFSNEVYWIEARGSKDSGAKNEVDFHSSPRKLVLSENLKTLKLVMSEEGFSEDCDEN